MNLRDKLREILPLILPRREQEAIKGKELISRVRSVLGEAYSDGSLRTQFSLLALEADTCLARVPNGQGYYLRRAGDPLPSLHDVFDSNRTDGADAAAESVLHRAIALAVRFYDTAGMSVFAYPVEEESWGHPDLVAVQWPAGCWGEDGAYVMAPGESPRATLRAVCVGVGVGGSPEACRQVFYRALACGQWAQETELLLIGPAGDAAPELERLAAQYGVGVHSIATPELPEELPQAESIFRAGVEEARELLAALPQALLARPRYRALPAQPLGETPDVQPVHEWVQQCIARGRVEPYERRVALG